MHGGLGLHVHVLSQPVSPAQISPFAQSALVAQVFAPAPPSAAAAVAASGFAGSAVVPGAAVAPAEGAVAVVAGAAGSTGAAVVAAAAAELAGSEVGGAGGGFDPHASTSALSDANENIDAARRLEGRVMRAGNREPARTSTAAVVPADLEIGRRLDLPRPSGAARPGLLARPGRRRFGQRSSAPRAGACVIGRRRPARA